MSTVAEVGSEKNRRVQASLNNFCPLKIYSLEDRPSNIHIFCKRIMKKLNGKEIVIYFARI